MAERARRPRVALLPVETMEDVDVLVDGLQRHDVWRNLDLPGPQEQRGRFFAKFVSGWYAGHLIVDADTGERYGFFLLHLKKLKSQGRVEVDIAIPDPAHRKLGLSKLALVALFDHWLGGARCREMWGWIDAGNQASVKMIESLDIPIYNRTERVIANEGKVPIIEVHMTPERWATVRPRLAAAWGR